jgi:hypothetical protein
MLVNVSVDDPDRKITCTATVPVASGSVIVRSAVGSVTASVVSKLFAVAPSNSMLEPNTPTAAGACHSTPYVALEFAVST